MKTLYDVLPLLKEGFMIINYDTNNKYTMLKGTWRDQIRVEYVNGTVGIFDISSKIFSYEDMQSTNWSLGLQA